MRHMERVLTPQPRVAFAFFCHWPVLIRAGIREAAAQL
jgi:hypothetical protein